MPLNLLLIFFLQRAKKENARRKALEKKATEAAQKAEALKEKKVKVTGGAMDQLIDSMRTGQAFNKRERGNKRKRRKE